MEAEVRKEGALAQGMKTAPCAAGDRTATDAGAAAHSGQACGKVWGDAVQMVTAPAFWGPGHPAPGGLGAKSS